MAERLKSRKLWLTIAAALLPPLLHAIAPDLPAEKIALSIVGLLGGVLGLTVEDVAKAKSKIETTTETEK